MLKIYCNPSGYAACLVLSLWVEVTAGEAGGPGRRRGLRPRGLSLCQVHRSPLLQAHLHLSCCIPGLRVLRLLRCCLRDTRARSSHQILAQREMGLYRYPLRVPPVCPQEVASQDHMMARQWLASRLISLRALGFICWQK